MKKPELKIGGHCFVYRPESSFSGVVTDIHTNWVKVAGAGSQTETLFHEWFPIDSLSKSKEAYETNNWKRTSAENIRCEPVEVVGLRLTRCE